MHGQSQSKILDVHDREKLWVLQPDRPLSDTDGLSVLEKETL